MVKTVDVIKLDPKIMQWARERINMTVEEAAEKLKKSPQLIRNWELGNSEPSYSQLEKLAYDVYKVPLAVFFLNEPPKEQPIKKEFRTIPEKDLSKIPYEFMIQIRQGHFFLESLKEIFNGQNPNHTPIFKQFNQISRQNLVIIANKIRQYLGISKTIQEQFRDSTEAFKFYRSQIEHQGLFIFQQTLKDYCRGYSIYDPSFPIIIVNSSEESYSGKCFTLFHELGHILFQTGGITFDFYRFSNNSIEVLCNQLASLILVNRDELLSDNRIKRQKDGEFDNQLLRIIAKEFKVSQEVVLRILLDSEIVTQEFYGKKRDEWSRLSSSKKKGTGGDYYANKFSKIGENYSSIVLTNLHSGRINAFQASEYLGVKINQLPKIERLTTR